ncbi:sigma-54-dependent transcriptional regulator [Acidihalobacter ferrooxydans]|uniref:Sigma-54-dependent Fis family transcriptional regulator n=1 Tax=Acidihalobacter ferrooxydans TaxID=1765967 RepID=A0A1P8UJE4_9GAMM|nr:sigma-54 dependent transcriptional regulator [Acidihalobacter ferrooxydans]APZ43957.1 sigma-54-dependent Fis family transcriptional regulator [Acidihalobacter ferrooxydans]
MPSQHILIIDDEADIRELLEITFSRMGLLSRAAADLAQARALLAEAHFDLCLTDLRLPDGSGLDLVEHVQRHHPHLPVAVITAHGSMDTAIAALKAGAFDFLNKPIELPRLRALIEAALKTATPPPDAPPGADRRATRLLGDSPAMDHIRATVAKLARSQAPVYIHGESGTGKELIARQIHDQSPRRTAAFVPVNCGAIPAELVESEFFGHLKGSFTGAVADRQGLFQAADGGTLFLDEVADLPLPMQVKLLRAIQERRIKPVGATAEIPVDVRLLSATHKNLADEVAAGRFRQDLYYRLNVIELLAPPLRERRQDIPQLAQHILDRLGQRGATPAPTLSPDALECLCRHTFPGNVRELENILERATALCDGDRIQPADLRLQQADDIRPDAPATHAPDDTPSLDATSLDATLIDHQREIIRRALEQTRWNKTEAARQLGMTFRQLRYRLKKLGIE